MIAVDVSLTLGAFQLAARFATADGITALFGRSGAGKTTVMNLIAGLARPDRGRIELDGRTLVDTEARVFVPRHRRRIGVVFQDARLFPHLTVRQNLLFGRWFAPRGDRRLGLEAVVETLGIAPLLDRRPALLSGGETQRVAFGRAVLAAPRLLLMDEPLAALDHERKLEILPLIERMRDEFRIPIVYVSHAVEEVARLAANVVVLEAGRVRQAGPPSLVLVPAAAEQGRFDAVSVLQANVREIDDAYALTVLDHPAGPITLAGRLGSPGTPVRVLVRPTDVALARQRPAAVSVRTVLTGTVTAIDGREGGGPIARIALALDGRDTLFAFATRKSVDELELAPGETVFALIKAVSVDERSLAAGRAG